MRLLMWIVSCSFLSQVPEECQEPKTEHVEGCHSRGDDADQPEDPTSVRLVRERLPKDLVLREEASQRRNAGNSDGRDCHHPEGPRDVPAQTAHVAHVLFAAQGMNHRTRCEKEQRLEEGVSH